MANLDTQVGAGPAGNKERWIDLGGGVFARLVGAVLQAGTAIIGQVSIDQTTPGTTNGVQVNAALPSGENHVGEIGGRMATVRVEKTRPNDTTAYAANDAVSESASAGTNWGFAVGRTATGSGIVIGAYLACDDTALVARAELDLYDDTITAINDNAEATRLYANQGKYIGTIAFPAAAKKTTGSTQAEAANEDVRIPFKCVGSSSIYGILRLLDADTPVANAKYQVTLRVAQN